MTFFPNRFEEYLHFFKEPVLLFTRLLTVLLDSQICSQSLVFFFSKQCFHHSILSINTLAAIQGCLKRSRCPISPQWQFWYAIFLCYIFHPQNSLWSTLMEMFSSEKKKKKKKSELLEDLHHICLHYLGKLFFFHVASPRLWNGNYCVLCFRKRMGKIP